MIVSETGAVDGIVALFGKLLACRIGDVQCEAVLFDSLFETCQLQIDNLTDFGFVTGGTRSTSSTRFRNSGRNSLRNA